ncbi:alpha/beta hydrolase [Mesorhizobium sp. B2-7-3]|uniref:alpha/beta fold hydrolase n=1 Tax=unclassified Mesorhizobium TaxID=325217 RepID=UPI0011272229|nr:MULTISPECIES: alpha/beta hydrolase [unclassified Mesorhizobium]MBZ9930212.1 alpha/beta hydrolase [Mesorhizobium sp. BR1-1-5]MBZ9681737.1 alpha/beta hydrolase [Mesorhizobium sp. CO1-1-2]MBZ9905881.1 alpha/beta hydrolase [Mesorhizobium sp. BR115XR7A]MBZ9926487.1 alpha/beta hydrolase [Mesorhizobium sp. BR1-1-4]TPJ13255.1 alpha/beta hydrolase [Mesorhizobium sp. B2-7-3]
MPLTHFLTLGTAVLLTATAPASAADVPKKTVVLVHGAFADGSSWSKVIPLLEAKGLNVVAVQNPLSSLAADVDATMRVIDAQPGPVILVGHSWAGVVISQAGVNDKVKALVYVAAFAPPKGVSINELGKGQPPPPWASALQPDSGGYLRLSAEGVAKYFAQDLPPAEIGVIAATQGPAFSGIFDEKLTAAAYETKPSWYIVARHDGMIPPAAEAAMAKAIGAKVTELPTSHVAMLAKPREVADVILAAVDSVK